MKKMKKGSNVVRISHGKDIIFIIDKILKKSDGTKIAILKGITERIVADSNIDDLELVENDCIEKYLRGFNLKVDEKINEQKRIFLENNLKRITMQFTNGRILHLDGDKRYSEKSLKYYQNIGLTAIVKNVAESRQPKVVYNLLKYYKPDILVITRT